MVLSGIQTIGGEKNSPITPLKNIKIRAKNIKSKKLLRKKKPSSVPTTFPLSCHREGCFLVSRGDLAFESLANTKKAI